MDLRISEMMQMQKDLFAIHAHEWTPMEPKFGKDFILYMIEEVGETISILKKKGHDAVMQDPVVRQAFLEEMADILMFYHEILLRFDVTPEEISQAYAGKHGYDMKRDYNKQYKELYTDGKT